MFNQNRIKMNTIIEKKSLISTPLIKDLFSEFHYINLLHKRERTTYRSQGRSISSESKSLSKKYNVEFLQDCKDSSNLSKLWNEWTGGQDPIEDLINSIDRVIKYHNDKEKKKQLIQHSENLESVLQIVFDQCESIIREQFKPVRFQFETSFKSIEKEMKEKNIPLKKPSFFDREKMVFNNDQIYKICRSHVEDLFNVNFEERSTRTSEEANQFALTLINMFRTSLNSVLDSMEKRHLDSQIHKLKENLIKYIPLGIDEIKDLNINQGSKGFEISASLCEKNEVKNTIRTFAHGAGGWNIQSFHFRYKTTLK